MKDEEQLISMSRYVFGYTLHNADSGFTFEVSW